MGSKGSAVIQSDPAPRDLGPGIRRDERIWEILDRRLLRDSARPVAVALSGGGDSLALALIADAWAREKGRELLVLTVDHCLQADSADWTAACAATAERLGRPFRALAWEGEKPKTGLPAAARRVRHALLADAAREAGATVILMGHTADDVAEAHAMRAAGATTPDAREWSPSPAWPEGRGVFLLRPLLGCPRAALRTWLEARGETWIEDPANVDPRYARSRARAIGVALVRRHEKGAEPREDLDLKLVAQGGVLILDRPELQAAWPDQVRRVLAMACVCAGGGARLPTRPRVARLAEAVMGAERFVSTLAGARIDAQSDTVRIAREPGEAARGGLQPRELPVGREVVWDGRFAAMADEPGLIIRPTRRGHPEVVRADGSAVSAAPRVTLRPLVEDRFRAAAGLVVREPA